MPHFADASISNVFRPALQALLQSQEKTYDTVTERLWPYCTARNALPKSSFNTTSLTELILYFFQFTMCIEISDHAIELSKKIVILICRQTYYEH